MSISSHNLEETIIELFNVITSSNYYNNFGENKALMLIGILENNSEYSIHHNIYLNSNSNYKDYYNQVKDSLSSGYEEENNGYRRDFIPYFKVRIWNLDNNLNNNIKLSIQSKNKVKTINNIRSYSTINNNRNYIKPLINEEIKLKEFVTLDIETILSPEGKQLPYLITLTHDYNTIYFQASNPSTIDNSLFNELINYLIDRKITNIFVHNLGSFDGYFIYLGLLKFDADKVQTNPSGVGLIVIINLLL